MVLPVVWFVLVAVLFVGYFILEGFDYGVGILLPWVAKTDVERRAVLATIGPVWDANEVWLITAAGAMFAAFPNWYATLFSGFYLVLFLLIVSLVFRGVSIEFRSKDVRPQWRRTLDTLIFIGSLIPPLVWGLVLGNLLHGVPINAQMNYVGSFGTLLNPYALVGAVSTVLLFTLHGALYLGLKAPDQLGTRAQALAYRVGLWATVFYFGFVALSYVYSGFAHKLGVNPGPIPILAGVSMISVRFLLPGKRYGWAFAATALTIALSAISAFLVLFPNVMISSLNPRWNLTIYNASSNPYSLKVMSIMALFLIPLVLAYQAWSYWVFRRRVRLDETFHY